MKKVVIYKGRFQYGADSAFAEALGAGFRELGFQCELPAEPSVEEAEAALKGASLCVGFNGIGAQLRRDGASLSERAGVPFLFALMDHPAFHVARLEERFPGMRVSCHDPSHLAYLRALCGESLQAFLLPHGGCAPDGPEPAPQEGRDIQLLFPGSFLSPDACYAPIAKLPAQYKALADEIVERQLSAEPQAIEKPLADWCAARGASLFAGPEPLRSFSPLLKLCDLAVRANRRLALLKAFDEAGLAVAVCGEGWPQGLFKRHRLLGPKSFAEILELMGRAKAVLNARVSCGSHERIPSALLCGAVCLSDRNDYCAALFKEDEGTLYYSWLRIEEAPAMAARLLESPEELARLAEAGRRFAANGNRWQDRAKTICESFGLTP